MVDHRRTPSQRAYQLPGWFFVLTGLLGVLGLAVAVVVIADVPLWERSPQRTPQPSPSALATESVDPTATPTAGGTDDRTAIDVLVFNASETPGLAARAAETAEEAGWTVGEVGNWIYGAAVNAVYYPEGHQADGELLAEDLDIDSVRPATSGMSSDGLTVLLVFAP